MTTKILDNTIITAIIKDIKCLDLLEKCCLKYKLATSNEVYIECKDGFSDKITSKIFNRIELITTNKNVLYNELLNYLVKRYPFLHKGELSSFLLSLLEFDFENRSYFYITDDGKMREFILKINSNKDFLMKINKESFNFKLTGTIGLVKHLKRRNLITNEEKCNIANDLEKSESFRIANEYLEYLCGNRDET
ncbi:MAG: hypothetical protein HZR80_10035 [Candidatus Heimdallarchaeota archaeon]